MVECLTRRLSHITALGLVLLFAVGTGQAIASFEPANFEFFGEFPQTGSGVAFASHPRGLATNDTTGNVYEADSGNDRVLEFNSEGQFLQAWGWGVADQAQKFERCGPQGEKTFPICLENPGTGVGGEGEGELLEPWEIAVDQTTGNVYVLSRNRAHGVVQEYTSEGTPIGGFGEAGNEKPEQISSPPGANGIAVDGSGNVFIAENPFNQPARVLEFEQVSPISHVYSTELFRGALSFINSLAIDHAGDFVLSSEEAISDYAAGSLATPRWKLAAKEVEGVTVDPASGQVLYYSKKENKFYILSPAGAQQTTFEGPSFETGAEGVVFNPNTTLGGRPPGVLYVDETINNVAKRKSGGLIFAQPPLGHPPVIAGEAATSIGTNFATLKAEVNPEGSVTQYRFEYGTSGPCASNPCQEAPSGGASAGTATTPKPVSVALSGLTPGATYHFRVVAENGSGLTDGADGTFTTFTTPTGQLPDGRAYEMVSPSEKHGGEVFPIESSGSCEQCEPGGNATFFPEEASPNGEAVAYEGFPFLPTPKGGSGGVDENEYLAQRTPTGWNTSYITPELLSTGGGFGFRAFDSNLAVSVIKQEAPPLAPGALDAGEEELYLRKADGTLLPLITEPPVNPKNFHVEYGGGSADLQHIVFGAEAALTRQAAFAPAAPEATEAEPDLYEWSSAGVRLVNVAEGNKSAVAGAVLGAGRELAITTEARADYCGAVSSDGSRIFWSSLADGRVFVRENGERTFELPDAGKFLCASSDGARVLLNDGHLYDIDEDATIDLTEGLGGFLGLVGASQDFRDIYFVDTSVLAARVRPGGPSPTGGADNLYLYEAGSGPRFIATLSPKDNGNGRVSVQGDWVASPSDRNAQVTPDGRFLAFESVAPLPGNEPNGPQCGREAGDRCPEVYEYDATAGTLTCASCSPTGLPASAGAFLSVQNPIEGPFPQPHNLADNGRLFFDTTERLSAEDAVPGVKDVYEYEQNGKGTCTEERGCIMLISSGRSAYDASFFSASSDGRDVFFTTRQQLLPEADRDELVDLYDAREGGGFTAPVAPVACSGEGCRPVQAAPPATPAPSSIAFTGSGNLAPQSGVKPSTAGKPPPAKKCRKGTVRKRHKCVKVKHKKPAKRAHKSARGASVEGRAER